MIEKHLKITGLGYCADIFSDSVNLITRAHSKITDLVVNSGLGNIGMLKRQVTKTCEQ